MEIIIYYASWALFPAGVSMRRRWIGVLRLPDFYSRQRGRYYRYPELLTHRPHAQSDSLNAAKLVMVLVFLTDESRQPMPSRRPPAKRSQTQICRGERDSRCRCDAAGVPALVSVAVTRMTNLFATSVLTGVYSLLMACIFTVLDAVDVAFTEAAVGAGISTVLFLATLSLTTQREKPQQSPNWKALLVALLTGGALVYGTFDMPRFGDPQAPVHQHVGPHYTSVSPTQIGVPNMVTSVLASYRGYDTLGETAVIFTACMAILLLLQNEKRQDEEPAVEEQPDKESMEHAMILRVLSKVFIPLILLFGLYVQFHGDFGPGGGFQAGVIFAAGIILYSLINGLDKARQIIPPNVLHGLVAFGLCSMRAPGWLPFGRQLPAVSRPADKATTVSISAYSH